MSVSLREVREVPTIPGGLLCTINAGRSMENSRNNQLTRQCMLHFMYQNHLYQNFTITRPLTGIEADFEDALEQLVVDIA